MNSITTRSVALVGLQNGVDPAGRDSRTRKAGRQFFENHPAFGMILKDASIDGGVELSAHAAIAFFASSSPATCCTWAAGLNHGGLLLLRLLCAQTIHIGRLAHDL